MATFLQERRCFASVCRGVPFVTGRRNESQVPCEKPFNVRLPVGSRGDERKPVTDLPDVQPNGPDWLVLRPAVEERRHEQSAEEEPERRRDGRRAAAVLRVFLMETCDLWVWMCSTTSQTHTDTHSGRGSPSGGRSGRTLDVAAPSGTSSCCTSPWRYVHCR